MGMDDNMLMCIKALAENRIQDAKEYAIHCCINDTTKKNESKTAYYKKLLENGSVKLFELPPNLKGLISMQAYQISMKIGTFSENSKKNYSRK